MNLDDQLKRIQDKFQVMLTQFTALRRENERLRHELRELHLSHAEKSTQVDTLTQRVEILGAAKSQLNDEEKRAFERRINQYLKEIERCITLIQE